MADQERPSPEELYQVSHRFARPPATVVVIPGVNGLTEKEPELVWLAVMSVILTISGVH